MWQIQNCGQFSVTGKAVVELFGAMMGDGDGVYGAYEYDLSDGRDLSAFGIEQQSGIIADYYVLNETIKNGPWESAPMFDTSALPAGTDLRPLYEKTLANFHEDPSYIRNHCAGLE